MPVSLTKKRVSYLSRRINWHFVPRPVTIDHLRKPELL